MTLTNKCYKMTLYAFNPDTDLALANGTGNYTPTTAVSQLITDLAMLPVWYAKPGSYVLVPTGIDNEFLLKQNEMFHLNVSLICVDELKNLEPPVEVNPWGWNHSFCNRLKRAGISEKSLPDDAELELRRNLSQRGMVAMLLDKFRYDADEVFCGISRNLKHTFDCAEYFYQLEKDGGVVFKEPWSSSGKGLLWCRNDYSEKDRNWCQRVIDNEGYVTVSPIYNKVKDFAMEFYVHANRQTDFIGYSLFDTDRHGYYQGNSLLSDMDILNCLGKYVPKEKLEKTKQMVADFLGSHGYQGCVGVDMMICKEGEEMKIHPCVEINYRHTMGYVARVLKDQYLAEQAQGRFMIEHFRTHKNLVDFVEEKTQKAPLVVKAGRACKGFMPLVPISSTSQNLAYIEIY